MKLIGTQEGYWKRIWERNRQDKVGRYASKKKRPIDTKQTDTKPFAVSKEQVEAEKAKKHS